MYTSKLWIFGRAQGMTRIQPDCLTYSVGGELRSGHETTRPSLILRFHEHNTTQHNTTQHNTMQRSTPQNNHSFNFPNKVILLLSSMLRLTLGHTSSILWLLTDLITSHDLIGHCFATILDTLEWTMHHALCTISNPSCILSTEVPILLRVAKPVCAVCRERVELREMYMYKIH